MPPGSLPAGADTHTMSTLGELKASFDMALIKHCTGDYYIEIPHKRAVQLYDRLCSAIRREVGYKQELFYLLNPQCRPKTISPPDTSQSPSSPDSAPAAP